jgi:hypothetical protein
MKRLLFFISVSFLFYSCATTNYPGIAQYTLVPERNVFSARYSFVPDGNIIIKRDGGFMGSALGATLFVNNEKFVQLSSGAFFRFKLSPGTYFVSLLSGEVVNLGKPFERTLKLDIMEQNRPTTIRVFPMPGQGMMMEEVYE